MFVLITVVIIIDIINIIIAVINTITIIINIIIKVILITYIPISHKILSVQEAQEGLMCPSC